ncbi:MAG: NAD(P)/FAD-dependent oxidoreductase [Thermodesulfobacteriota bacterium]
MFEITDVLIIGSGPAGLQAALHAARKKASVVVLGRRENSAMCQAHVENYLFLDGINEGEDMLKTGREQVLRFGAQMVAEDVLGLEQEVGCFAVRTESRSFKGRTVILAMGSSIKKLKVKGEKDYVGKGISYCVDCDANFYRNARVAVVGNESAAVDGALTLLGYASEVHLITRGLNVSEGMKKKLESSGVKFHNGTWVKELAGKMVLERVSLEDGEELEIEGLFVELGAKGAMELATAIGVQMDMETFSYIATNKRQETNIEGVYAAGDIAGPPRQIAKAVGEGCLAGWYAANHAFKLKKG